jgi:hypothetical protein
MFLWQQSLGDPQSQPSSVHIIAGGNAAYHARDRSPARSIYVSTMSIHDILQEEQLRILAQARCIAESDSALPAQV